jgi:hypothetical protein
MYPKPRVRREAKRANCEVVVVRFPSIDRFRSEACRETRREAQLNKQIFYMSLENDYEVNEEGARERKALQVHGETRSLARHLGRSTSDVNVAIWVPLFAK